MTVTINDLYWSAGFLEGDGSFGYYSSNHAMSVTAAQVQKAPLLRLQRLFGGTLIAVPPNPKRPNKQPAFRWRIVAGRAAGVAMTLFPLMSRNSKSRIKAALKEWKRAHENKYKTLCPQGHEYNEANTYWYRGSRRCLPCRKWHDARRSRNWKVGVGLPRGAAIGRKELPCP